MNCWTAEYNGKTYAFRELTALERLRLPQRAARLHPLLSRLSLGPREALALGYHCALLRRALGWRAGLLFPAPAAALYPWRDRGAGAALF